MLTFIHKDIVRELYRYLHELKTKDIIDEYNVKWKKYYSDEDMCFEEKKGIRICQYRDFSTNNIYNGYFDDMVYPFKLTENNINLYIGIKIPARYFYTCIKSDFIE